MWLVDFTSWQCRPAWSGMAFTAFVHDAFSRRIVGWRTAASMPTELPLDALEMALWTRACAGQDITGLVHHSDAGSQYTAIRYSDRLLDAGAVASYRHRRGQLRQCPGREPDRALPGRVHQARRTLARGVDDLELTTPSWVHWFNETRLHSSLGHVPPLQYEAEHYRHITSLQQPLPGEPSLH